MKTGCRSAISRSNPVYAMDCPGDLINRIAASGIVYLFLDYDGTLTGFRKKPEDARPSKRLIRIIDKIISNDRLIPIIVSGRSIETLIDFFKDIDTGKIIFSGVHGSQVKFTGSNIEVTGEADKCTGLLDKIKDEVKAIIEDFPCYHIEDKKTAFALHYRNCNLKDYALVGKIKERIREFTRKNPLISCLDMKKVVEVKPANINKGHVINLVMEKYRNFEKGICICMGDDLTDEYLFRANPGGINIKVGEGQTGAGYFLKNVGEVHFFLERICRLE